MATPVAIITGTNSGVGLALSVMLASNHVVYAGMRSLAKKSDLMAAAAQAKVEANVRPFELDVNSDESVESALGAVTKEAGRVDILVNNAGYSVFGSVEMVDMAKCKEQFETNFFGVIRCQKAVLPFMRQQRSGKIINISSVGGVWGQPFNDVYCASKFALEGLSESQAAVFRTFGVHVSLVEPGAIKSAFFHNAQRPDMTKVPAEYVPALQSTSAAYGQSSGMGQTPEEVARVIIDQIVSVAEPPLRVQTNPAIQAIFEQQLANPNGEAGVLAAKKRFLSSI